MSRIMLRTARLVAALIFLPALQGEAAPSLGAGEVLSFADALQVALESNDFVLAESARLEAAASDVVSARSGLLPRLTVEERFMRTDTPGYVFATTINQGRFSGEDLAGAPASFNDPGAVSDFQSSLSLRQPIFSRRASLGLEMSKAETEAVELEVGRAKEKVAFEVYRAYLGAQIVESYLETAKAAEQDAREHLRLAGVMEKTDVGLLSDRLRAEVAHGEARRNLLRVENDLAVARRGLGLAIGLDVPVRTAGDILVDWETDIDRLTASLPARGDIAAMQKRVENGVRNIDLANAGRIPEVGLFGTVQANDPDYPFGLAGTGYSAGIGVTWSIFDGKATAAAKARAAADLERAERFLSGMLKEASFLVHESRLRVSEAEESLKIARGALAAAEEGVRLLRVRYENGLATIVSLLDAQAALNKARADIVKARMGHLEALGELNYRAGTLLDTLRGPLHAGG